MKSNTSVKFKGVKAKLGEYFRTHMDPGHGRNGALISGAHTPSAFRSAIARYGGQFRRVGEHPADARIKTYEYALPDGSTGVMRPYRSDRTKTTYSMPQSEFRQMALEAVKNALVTSRGNLPMRWTGVTKDGIRMTGFARPIRNGFEIRSAWFEW